MNQENERRLVQGDFVEVRSADEIAATLDQRGSLDRLPFMPEMLACLGKKFRVSRHVEHFSFDGDETCGDESSVRAFPDNDVVILDGVRCSGDAHSGCKRGCTIFWKEAWLKSPSADTIPSLPGNSERLVEQLKTKNESDPELYFCQSSQLLIATHPLSWKERIRRCIRNVTTGNYRATEMARNLVVWVSVRGREKLFGAFPVGKLEKTPAESLDLQVGELVEVKSLAEIKATLDSQGLNRGLHFAPEMIPYCGRKLRVTSRADRMITEGIGTMRSMKNTVILENSVCDSATWAFGACPRQDHIYWREIWLRREVEMKPDIAASGAA